MAKNNANRAIAVLGIDLAKNSFQLHGVDTKGETVCRRKLSRYKLLEFMVNISPCLVGMEACGGSHYFARKFREFGHDVRMMAPQFVKPYVKSSHKNDAVDAEAICEAVQRPNMRFVPVKSVEQQDLQCLHRMRESAMSQRTAVINQARGFLLEYGIVLPEGSEQVRHRLPDILADSSNGLTKEMGELLGQLWDDLVRLDERIAEFDAKVNRIGKQQESCQLLQTIPGVGPLTATALVAAIGDVSVFKNGREMAAWLGLVPRQHTTGGKPRLLGISKRGDSYLRKLLVHGGRAALQQAPKKKDRLSRWVTELEQRRGRNVATVALAAKNVRIAWALLSKGEVFKAVQTEMVSCHSECAL